MANLSWKIGDTLVTRIVEVETPMEPAEFFSKFSPEAWASHFTE